jgi:uncharacterized membrane protein YeiH
MYSLDLLGTIIFAVTLGLRLAAIQWNLSLPQFFPKGVSDADR